MTECAALWNGEQFSAEFRKGETPKRWTTGEALTIAIILSHSLHREFTLPALSKFIGAIGCARLEYPLL